MIYMKYYKEFELMKRLEGMRLNPYKDTEGLRTVGVGFNMDMRNARMIWAEVGISESYYGVQSGVEPLSENSAYRLFEYMWELSCIAAYKRANILCVDYNELPDWHKFALADIVYNTGNCHNWTKVFKNKTPETVAIECRRTPHDVMDSRIAKWLHYYGFINTIEEAHEIGLDGARYIR